MTTVLLCFNVTCVLTAVCVCVYVCASDCCSYFVLLHFNANKVYYYNRSCSERKSCHKLVIAKILVREGHRKTR